MRCVLHAILCSHAKSEQILRAFGKIGLGSIAEVGRAVFLHKAALCKPCVAVTLSLVTLSVKYSMCAMHIRFHAAVPATINL